VTSPATDPPQVRPAARSALVADARAAFALAWRSGPWRMVAYGTTALLQSVLPVAVAALLRVIVDRLAADGADARLTGPAAGLVLTGLGAAALPHVSQYLVAELNRESALLADDGLYASVDRFVGLGRFEDPVFLDRLRCGQQAGGVTPSRVVQGIVTAAREAVTIVGFLALLVTAQPLVAVVVVLGALPVVIAEHRLARRRAAVMWSITPAQRRELFYGSLLTSVEAAKRAAPILARAGR
jgi:ATP-binding cassette subfamily B protein